MAALIKPKEITVLDIDGNELTYIISRFPTVQGREIIAKYPLSNMPKVGDYQVSEETMLKLMNFVAKPMPNGVDPLRLSIRVAIDQHVPDWEALAKIEWEMITYNCSFFQNGRVLEGLGKFVQNTMLSISKMLTDLSAPSSQAEKPASTSSEQSTT